MEEIECIFWYSVCSIFDNGYLYSLVVLATPLLPEFHIRSVDFILYTRSFGSSSIFVFMRIRQKPWAWFQNRNPI